jgi:hypothetical protein
MKKLITFIIFSLMVATCMAQSLPDYWVPTSGAANTYSTTVPTFRTGSKIAFVKFNVTNTGASTINIAPVGALALRKWDGDSWEPLVAGDIDTGTIYKIVNTGSFYELESFGSGGGASNWGDLGGTLSDQTDLQSALDAKQATLISGINIKTVNGSSLLGSGDVGTINITYGGTGLSSIGTAFQQLRVNSGATALEYFDPTANPMTTVGDLIQGGTSGAPTRLADVATGSVLLSGGIGASVLWGKVDLTTAITGVTPLANGGTNASLLASNGGIFYSTGSAGAILLGTATANKMLLSGSSAAPTWSTSTIPSSAGTSGNILTSDGTNWLSSAATFWNRGGSTTLSSANTITGTSTNTITFSFASLGTTITDGAGIYLNNTTAAALGAQQISPVITLEGRVWETGGNTSQIVKWQVYDLPVQNGSAPSHTLTFKSTMNGVAVIPFTMGSAGNLGFTFSNGDTYSFTPTSSGTMTLRGAVTSMMFDRFGQSGMGNFGANTLASITRGILIQNTGSAMTVNTGILTSTAGTIDATVLASGTAYNANLIASLTQASGTGNYTSLRISNVFNTSGSYSGTARAIDYDPTESVMTGVTHYFITNRSTTALSGFGVASPTAYIHLGAGVTANAPLRINLGVAPSSPNNGDIWNETTNNRLMFQKNGTSVEFIGVSAVNSVTPTLQDRTLTVVIGGTTYYITAKTTND